MATYECNQCEMVVNATCAKCNEPLINDHLDVNGQQVQISKCPSFARRENKISSMLWRGYAINAV